MREIGGGQCWNWTPQLIEAKLIDLGYEEVNVDEKTHARKRRRVARRRHAAAAQQQQQHHQNPALLHAGEQQHWVGDGLTLHPGAMQVDPMQHHHHDDGSEDPDDMLPHYTAEQRDHYIDEVVRTIKPEQDESSPEPDVMDASYHGSEGNRDQSHQQQSARVAKQAVEQLMLNGIRM